MLSMSRKKVFLLVVSLLLISLFSNAASAQEGGIGEGLGSAFDTIRQLFAFLPDLITLEGLLGEEPAAIFWAKFLVWLFLFAVVYFGTSAIPGMKESKNIAIVIAIVISLMGALLIPNDILVNIFQTYGLLAGIILWIIPVAAGMFIAHKVTLPFFRALVYGTAAWILWSINATVVKKMGLINTSFPYFGLLFAVVVIMFFVNLIAIFGGAQGPAAVGGWFGDRGRDAWDWATRDRSGDRGLLDRFRRRREPRTAEEEQHLVYEAQRVSGNITKLERQLLDNLKTTDERELLRQLAELIKQLEAVQTELRTLARLGENEKPVKEVQNKFDKLIRDIIGHINRIINNLKKDKEKIIQIYRDEVQGYYRSKREAVQNRGAEFDTLAEEREAQIPADKKAEFDNLVAQLNKLREELEKLLEGEMQIEGLVGQKIKDEPERIGKEIGLMDSLLEHIKRNVKLGNLFSRGKLISLLNTEAMYQRIINVYDEVKSRETEKKAVEYYFGMKKEIEQKSEEILSGIRKLMAILGVKEKAVSPKAVKKKEKAVEKAKKVLKREENYFMLFNEVLKRLREVAASNLPPEGKLKEAQALLKRLKRYESREQWRASARKLEGKLKRLLKIPLIDPQEKKETEKLVRELKIFEADALVKTVRDLGEKIKGGRGGVQAEQVNWQEIIAIIDQIQKDIQAVIAVEERLDKWLESERKGIRGRVGAGLGKVGAGLGAAGRGAGGAIGVAGRGIGRARLAGAGRAVGGAIGRVIGRKQGTDRVLLEETKSILRQFMEGTISEDSAYRGLRGLVDQNPSLYLSDNLKKNRPDLLNNAFAWAANGVLPPLSHYRRRMTTAKDTKYTINEAVGIGFYSKRIGNIAKRLVDEEERKRRYISKHPPRV